MIVPFSPPDISEKEIERVVEVLKSGWITTGKQTKEFENNITQYCNSSKTVCLNSATAALESVLRILGIKSGDEVITTAYTYTATASVICHVGATPILVDVKKNSFEMDIEKLIKSITCKTKAIIAVDIGGVICNYKELLDIVENYKKFTPNSEIQSRLNRIAIIADAAHSFGAVQKGRKSGNIADFTCFSFHAVKNITTAEGGAITWRQNNAIDDEKLYKDFTILNLHGQTKDAFLKNIPGSWEYDIVTTGYKNNMTDIAAAIGIEQLKSYENKLAIRSKLVQNYNNTFEKLSNVEILKHTGKDFTSSFHLYLLRIKSFDEELRNEFIKKASIKGISLNVHYKPLPMLTAYKNMGFNINDFQESYNQYKCLISLPLFSVMTDEMQQYVISNFLNIYEEMI